MNEHQLSLELASEPAANAAITVGLFFGGRSAEHAISLRSAATLCIALREAGYWVVPIGIERSGAWRYMPLAGADFPTAVDANACAIALAPGRGGQLMACEPCDIAGELPRIDVAFPALHGPFGEDGRLQGLFETCGVPYVGAGVLGGAVTMDKELTKRLLLQAGLPVVPYRLHRRGRALPTYAWLSERLGPRLFVKPASLGSSIGANPAHDEASLAFALSAALEHDDTVLDVPSHIDTATASKVRELAREAFEVLRCRDLARVDFFLDAQGQLFVNEVNTLPGFTSASLYPRMFETSGLPIREQVRHLVESALARS